MNLPAIDLRLNLEHTYADQLPGTVASCWPTPVAKPRLLRFNESLASELGLDCKELTEEVAARIFSGNDLPSDARPIAQAYAGHQFGVFVPQLGDGRALVLGEVIDRRGVRRDIALKGSGQTPFSRGGDGRAAVGPVLREYLIAEAMHALGIPTTRALAAVATSQPVMRDRRLPGAVLTRVAASHIRVGTFQYFAARGQIEQVRQLAEYVIQRHYPELSDEDDRYLLLLQDVAERQAALVAKWMLVGFIHGVMNTDNMAVSGETIDYGPCAFIESYDPATVFSSIDHGGRYAYGNQPSIAIWNLARFAETLLPLLGGSDSKQAVADATAILEGFTSTFELHFYSGARAKLGLAEAGTPHSGHDGEEFRQLIDDWLQLLQGNDVDFTLAWRWLADAAEGNANKLRSQFSSQAAIDDWIKRWRRCLSLEPSFDVASRIRAVNPIYIPRNHLVEEAIAAASDDGELTPFERLLEVLQHPLDERPQWRTYARPAPANFTANYTTFCGT